MNNILQSMVRFGHYRLSSGFCSNCYFQVLNWITKDLKGFSSAVKETVKGFQFPFTTADYVICPALGAIPVAHEVARAMGLNFIWAERDQTKRLTLRRGQRIRGEKFYLIVEDTISTGSSSEEVAKLVVEGGGFVAGFFTIVDRQPNLLLTAPKVSMFQVEAKMWESTTCPLCQDGIPIDKPGSRWL